MIEIYKVRSDQNLQKEYDSIYRKQPIRHSISFYKWILGLLCPKSGRKLLDVACGQGVVVKLAQEGGLVAYGLDISLQAVRLGNKLVVGNGQHIPFPKESFDYVTCIGSLEHYVDMEEGLREIARVLTPQGNCCILLPNLFSLFANVLFVWHTGGMPDDGQPIQRFATREQWRAIIEKNDLRVISTHKYEAEPPFTLRDFLGYFHYPKKLFRMVLTPLIPINLSNSFVFICKRRDN